jgi:hypothetical protein
VLNPNDRHRMTTGSFWLDPQSGGRSLILDWSLDSGTTYQEFFKVTPKNGGGAYPFEFGAPSLTDD